MPSQLRELTCPKIDIRMHIENPKKIYTTFDRIQGIVSIHSRTEVTVQDVNVEFTGTSKTFVDRVFGRAESLHHFLRLSQPGLENHYPENGILKAGQTYEFPFTFVIPQQLPAHACQHRVETALVQDAHLQLPPSLSDSTSKLDGMDDVSPEMSSIQYRISAKVSTADHMRRRLSNSLPNTPHVCSKSTRVLVAPFSIEQPPIEVEGKDDEYTLHKTLPVHKSLLGPKTGVLTMSAAQPRAIQLNLNDEVEQYNSTSVAIDLRFDPTNSEELPPSLGRLACKIQAQTFFGCTPQRNFASKALTLLDTEKSHYFENIDLSSRCMAGATWQKHSCPSREKAGLDQSTYYTLRLIVPIALPSNKMFVPTFDSCFISRSYALKLDLAVGNRLIDRNISLKLPLQICTEQNGEDILPQYTN